MQTLIKNYVNRIACFLVFLILLSCQDSTQIQPADGTNSNQNLATNTQTNENQNSQTQTDQATQTNTNEVTQTQTEEVTQTNTDDQTQSNTQTNTEITAPVFPVDGVLENVALGQLASQSSTEHSGSAARAIDGDTNGSFSGASVTHTLEENQPWWEVDLGSVQAISYIEIFNRTDGCCTARLADFYVLVSNTPFESAVLEDNLNNQNVNAFLHEGIIDGSQVIDASAFGQYVRIQLIGESNPLSLAEVQVMAFIGELPVNTDTQTMTVTDTDTQTDDTTYICPDMPTLLTELNCTNSNCHSAAASQAAKISLTGSIEDLANRFNDVDSINSNCKDDGEKVIDVANPSNSLMLKLVNPHLPDQCSTKMPVGTTGVSEDHYGCFESWVDEIANTYVEPIDTEIEPFIAFPAFSALNKVKNLLHGGAVTDAEVAAAINGDTLNPEGLKSLIDDWMQTPEFENKLSTFLQLTLQQKDVSQDDTYLQQLDKIKLGVVDFERYKQNFAYSFVKTAFDIVDRDEDFRTIATTTEWEVTTAILLALSYADYEARFPFRETIDGVEVQNRLRSFEFLCGDDNNEAGCDGIDDYADWRTVNLTTRDTKAPFEFTGEFAQSLRDVSDNESYAFLAPRVGFFTTPIFFQSWQSNVGNKFRLTINQTMIVGLGLTFEAGDVTPHGDLSALDNEHAGEQFLDCFACHRIMDPMRQVFANQYNVHKSRALEEKQNIPSAFAFHGMERDIDSLYDLGQAIADHPNFAKAWVGKMCSWATSKACDQSDEEFLRLVDVFKDSDYKLKSLIRELFTSPLVTGVEYIDAFETQRNTIVVNRANHFCKTIEARVNQARAAKGLPPSENSNICEVSDAARAKRDLLPQDEFIRGAIDLIQAVNVDPFLVSGYAQLCDVASGSVISFSDGEPGSANYEKTFSSNNPEFAISELVTYVLGIPESDPENEVNRLALQKMYDIYRHTTLCSDVGLDVYDDNQEEVQCGLNIDSNTDSLKLVWVAACASPSVMGMGF